MESCCQKYQIKGYHLVMNPKLAAKLTENKSFPQYLLANVQGRIDYMAPWPSDTVLLYSQLDQLLHK
jgi:hypothetical protein